MKPTSTRKLHGVHCPIEAELLLAIIQKELPLPDSREIYDHINSCDTCYRRYSELFEAYDQVASLGQEENVPAANLMNAVLEESQGRLKAVRVFRKINLRMRTVTFATLGTIVAIAIILALFLGPILQNTLLRSERSLNSLSSAQAIGSGLFYAETNKVIPVSYNGATWDIGEVIALNERNAQVVHSLPASPQHPFVPGLGVSGASSAAPVLSSDGKILLEPAESAGAGEAAAFASIDPISGKIRYISQLVGPPGTNSGAIYIHQMWLDAANTTLTILGAGANVAQGQLYVLRFNALTGKELSSFQIPLIQGENDLNTQAAVLRNGQMLVLATSATEIGKNGEIIQFIRPASGQYATQPLFIPGLWGIVSINVLADSSQIVVFNGETENMYFISVSTFQIVSTVPVAAFVNTSFTGGDISALSVSQDGTLLMAVLNHTIIGGTTTYSIWMYNIPQASIEYSFTVSSPVKSVSSVSKNAYFTLTLENGQVDWFTVSGASQLSPTPWIILAGNAQIINTIGSSV